jgi:hypothetical protein
MILPLLVFPGLAEAGQLKLAPPLKKDKIMT